MSNTRAVSQPKYATLVLRSATTDGSVCYLASHPELPNCFGQGQTPEAAEQDLGDATELVLQHLADSGLSIPEPAYLRGEKPLILQMPGEPA